MLTSQQQQLALGFLKDWLEWAESGAESSKYQRASGLCFNLDLYPPIAQMERFPCRETKKDIISHWFGGNQFPFGAANYFTSATNNTQHKDPARLAWVRFQIEVMEKC